jgi:metal-sulfur cluster biosynthetic enzyme
LGFAQAAAKWNRALPGVVGGSDMVTQEVVREALAEVQDPELHMGILDLGLVYDVLVEEGGKDVTVVMTLTSPMCPVGPMFTQAVQSKVESLEGVDRCKVDLTFSPPWDPKTMASDDVKNQLGIW